MNKDKVILGVDPGTTVLGYGIIKPGQKDIVLLSMGVVKLQKYDNHYKRLAIIYSKISGLIAQYKPTELAIEAPFFGKNVQSMLKLGRAQGIAIAAALANEIPVFEYAPKKIKNAITGNGNASKEQVAGMLKHLVPHEMTPKFFDATDGLATAVCHYLQLSKPGIVGRKQYKNWEAFLRDNPEKEI